MKCDSNKLKILEKFTRTIYYSKTLTVKKLKYFFAFYCSASYLSNEAISGTFEECVFYELFILGSII